MEETKSKDPNKKNIEMEETKCMRKIVDLGRLFPPSSGLVFLLWNSSVSLSSMKLECETLDFLLKLDPTSLGFKVQNLV